MPASVDYLLPVLGSAVLIGIYDPAKKAAVTNNPILPVLFLITLSGTVIYCPAVIFLGSGFQLFICSVLQWFLIAVKSILVAVIWFCAFYAIRELPLSLVAPLGAASPLLTLIGGIILFGEIPGFIPALGMGMVFTGYLLFSVAGKLEGIHWRRNRGIQVLLAGVVLEALSSLFDKFLLGTLGIKPQTVQLWFQIDLVMILGLAWLWMSRRKNMQTRISHWSWAFVIAGVVLIAGDAFFFYAVSLPDAPISTLSILKRGSCVVSFLAGFLFFREVNLKKKIPAMLLVILGIVLIAIRY